MTDQKLNIGSFKIVRLLSLIGNYIWGILFLIFAFACILNSEAVLNSAEGSVSPEGLFGNLIVLFFLLSVIVILLSFFCIRGLVAMRNGEKKGFYFYSIANGLWALIQFYIGSDGTIFFLISGLISIGFIFYFTVKLPKLS